MEIHMNERILKQLKSEKSTLGSRLLIIVILLALIVWSSTGVKLANQTSNGIEVAKNILRGIFTPDMEFLFDFSNSGVPYLLLETMCIAFLGTLVGAVLAIPFGFLGATNVVPKPVAVVSRFIVMAIRTIPTFVYGLLFVSVTGQSAFTGLLTLSVCSIGMLSKMYIESIEDLDRGILESLDACGCNLFQKIRYGVIPQLMPDFISTVIYRFDMNLRDASVLGLVGAGGIGAPLIFAMNKNSWNEVGSILVGLVVLILIIEFISSKIRNKLIRG